MNATKASDLDLERLVVELATVFPDTHNRVSEEKLKRLEFENAESNGNSVWLVTSMQAWQDVSWGWVSEEWGNKIKNNSGVRLAPCSQGGYLIQESTSIGD